MSDSNHPGNSKFVRIRRQLARAKPAWDRAVAVAKTFDDAKKVGSLLFYLVMVGGGGAFTWWRVTTPSDKPPAVVQKEAAKPSDPPQTVAPVMPQKPKIACSPTTLAKLRDDFTDSGTALTALKKYKGRSQCGWQMAVVDTEARDGGWTVTLERDGVRVFAEVEWLGGIRVTDFARVSGAIEAVSFDHGVLVITLKPARIRRE